MKAFKKQNTKKLPFGLKVTIAFAFLLPITGLAVDGCQETLKLIYGKHNAGQFSENPKGNKGNVRGLEKKIRQIDRQKPLEEPIQRK